MHHSALPGPPVGRVATMLLVLVFISDLVAVLWEQHAVRVPSRYLAQSRCLINICSMKRVNRI